jgi:hypothetical protein
MTSIFLHGPGSYASIGPSERRAVNGGAGLAAPLDAVAVMGAKQQRLAEARTAAWACNTATSKQSHAMKSDFLQLTPEVDHQQHRSVRGKSERLVARAYSDQAGDKARNRSWL